MDRVFVWLLTALILVAGLIAAPAAAAAVPNDASPPLGTYFWLTGPGIDPSHTSCGEFGCLTEANNWVNDSGYFAAGPEGCVTTLQSQACQFVRTYAVIVDVAATPVISVQKFYDGNPMTGVTEFSYSLPPNAFSATYRVLWQDGADASATLSVGRRFLVRVGTNPTVGDCVAWLAPTSATTPVDGPDCMYLGYDNSHTMSLKFGLPTWGPYDFVAERITVASTTPVRSMMPGLESTGPISFNGGAQATLRVVTQPAITSGWRVAIASTTVGKTTTLRVSVPTDYAAARPVDYYFNVRLYANASMATILPVTGTDPRQVLRLAGTAAAPVTYSMSTFGTSPTSTASLQATFDGVTPGTAYVRVLVYTYSGVFYPGHTSPARDEVVTVTVSKAPAPPAATRVSGWPSKTLIARSGRGMLKSVVVKVKATPANARKGVVQDYLCRIVKTRRLCTWVKYRAVSWPRGLTSTAALTLTASKGKTVLYRLVLPPTATGKGFTSAGLKVTGR